jgi:uncharacterized membrane protein
MTTDTQGDSQSVKRRARWYSPRSVWRSIAIRPRVYGGALVGIATLLLMPHSASWAVRGAAAWCTGGGTYLLFSYGIMSSCDSERIRSLAARQDDSAVVILALVLLAIFASFASIFGLVNEAKEASREGRLAYVGLAAATILIAWAVMQVVFTLHYAHEHYAPHNLARDGTGSLDFPNDPTPDYWDFLYFATSIGATSQTSDVSIRSKGMRRLVTLHAVVSFFFNTMVLAMTINLAASMA